jgi:hypothetical protein
MNINYSDNHELLLKLLSIYRDYKGIWFINSRNSATKERHKQLLREVIYNVYLENGGKSPESDEEIKWIPEKLLGEYRLNKTMLESDSFN